MNKNTREPEKTGKRSGEARLTRFVGRQALRRVTTDLRCFDCGRATVNPNGAVSVRRTDEGVVGFAGLASCGRIWLCPVCNAKVMARRAIEVGAAVAWANAAGYHLIWGSLTLAHTAESDLAELFELQTAAWRRLVSSKWWRSRNATDTIDHVHGAGCEASCERKRDILLSERPGRVGYIRAAELTIGFNGWHPHFHPLIVVRGTRAEAEAFAAGTVDRWVDSVIALGGHAVRDGGQQLRVLGAGVVFNELGSYMTKQTFDASALALELAWSQNKVGQITKGRAAKTQAHWSLLAEIAFDGGDTLAAVVPQIDRWQQLELAAPGKRMISWSRGLRRFAGVGEEVDDETIAAEEVGTADDDVCFITPDGWAVICDQPEVLAGILSALESGGWASCRAMLEALGVEYFTLVAA